VVTWPLCRIVVVLCVVVLSVVLSSWKAQQRVAVEPPEQNHSHRDPPPSNIPTITPSVTIYSTNKMGE
jgi:hypothetical protein